MTTHPLPPIVAGFADGKVTWQRLESIDYDTLGYLLSCHLIVEHYMDNFLATYPNAPFGWEAARLTFGQKVALIGGLPFPEPYNLPPIIKHLNSLRNRFGHNVTAKLTDDDLLPFKQFLARCTREGVAPVDDFEDAKDLLNTFTMLVCAYFASAIAHSAPGAKAPRK